MKNLKIYLGIIALLIFSLPSCDDGQLDYTIVKGQILEYGTQTPIEGAKVILYEDEVSWTGGLSYPIDTVITGADGSYEFRFNEKGGYAYTVRAFKDQYYDNEFLDILPFRENQVDLVLDPYAWLELHVKNVNPFDENDNIRFGGEWSGPLPTDNVGVNIDLKKTVQVRGNRFIDIYWSTSKNNATVQQTDSVFCAKHILTKYELFY